MAAIQQKTINNPLGKPNHFLTSSRLICTRCGGLLVNTFCISPTEGIAEFQIQAIKCLQCGDLFDSTILENRWRSQHHQLTQTNGGRKP